MDIKFLVVLIMVAVVFDHAFGASFIKKRDSEQQQPETSTTIIFPRICQSSSPCGWAVYNRYSREIDYFMRNKCECPKGKKCVRTDDDISVTAYVYRCMDEDNPSTSSTSTTTINSNTES